MRKIRKTIEVPEHYTSEFDKWWWEKEIWKYGFGIIIGLVIITLLLILTHKEESDELSNLLLEVDNADNEVQRIGWQDKTYIVFRYRGYCEPDEHLNIKLTECLATRR